MWCEPGFEGDICNIVCPYGFYGLKCEERCSGHCKDNQACNHTNGVCDKGCFEGWTGEHCDKECPLGTYGTGCVYNCNEHCLYDMTCNRTTGRCDAGCKQGYTGEHCDKECRPGAYGPGCIHDCSGHCLYDVTCNRTTGRCDQGCESGYSGMLCETASLQRDGLNENCKESSYIAGLLALVVIIIILVATFLVFLRRYFKLVKEMRSLQYSTITRISPQSETDAKDGHQYQELRIEENSYHNLTLRN